MAHDDLASVGKRRRVVGGGTGVLMFKGESKVS